MSNKKRIDAARKALQDKDDRIEYLVDSLHGTALDIEKKDLEIADLNIVIQTLQNSNRVTEGELEEMLSMYDLPEVTVELVEGEDDES